MEKELLALLFEEWNNPSGHVEHNWPCSLSFIKISNECSQVTACSSIKALHWEDSAGDTNQCTLVRTEHK